MKDVSARQCYAGLGILNAISKNEEKFWRLTYRVARQFHKSEHSRRKLEKNFAFLEKDLTFEISQTLVQIWALKLREDVAPKLLLEEYFNNHNSLSANRQSYRLPWRPIKIADFDAIPTGKKSIENLVRGITQDSNEISLPKKTLVDLVALSSRGSLELQIGNLRKVKLLEERKGPYYGLRAENIVVSKGYLERIYLRYLLQIPNLNFD